MKYKIKNSSQGGYVRLTNVSHKVPCAKCGHYLIFCNEGKVVLIKTYAHVLDLENDELMLKCGKCLQFNTITLKNLRSGESICKLII